MNGLDRLGATLLHFLWQGALIGAIYAAARRVSARPEVRYKIACAALAVLAASPAVTWLALQPPVAEIEAAASLSAPAAIPVPDGFGRAWPHFFTVPYPAIPARWLSWIAAVWIAGVMFFLLRLLGAWVVAERYRRRLVWAAPGEWQKKLDELGARLRVSRPVRLLVSGLAQAPAVVGLIRPVVLIPAGALSGLAPEQVEALLLHELAHIRRHDYVVNVLQSIVEALLFYHPIVWWVSGHMRLERELCCDDAAVAATGDAVAFARALAEVGAAGQARYPAMVAATGGSLADRVARLLGTSRPSSRTHPPAALAGAAVLIVITTIAVLGQTPRPKFDVASIKAAGGHGFATIQPLSGRLTANAPLRVLMEAAYHVQPFQIEGGPEWIKSERYEIDAKAAGNPARSQLFLMLQSVLEERFQLQIHRESRELPVYELVAARSGLKLPPSRDGSCVDPTEPLPSLPEPGGRMRAPIPGPTPPTRCGGLDVNLGPAGAVMRGGKVPMSEFVRTLSHLLGRPVTDRTGYAGVFDVKLDFLPDDGTPALPPPPPGAIAPEDASPSLFTAIQRLGLRLEPAKGPVEVLVIDHVERPTAN